MKIVIHLILFFHLSIFLYGEALLIPPLLKGPGIELTMQKGQVELNGKSSETFGYNGDYLGPTLLFRKGDLADVNVQNQIGEATTLHWHGMHIPAEYDGGPHQIIKADEEWNPRFQIKQNAATLWYHPHLMGRTAEHVYKGLAGLVIIEDEFSDSLDIPSQYGVNDIPLILQDRKLRRNGRFEYDPDMHDIIHGYKGNVLLSNGQINPELTVEGGLVRFRILNGSNSSLMRIRMDDERSFLVIASDGGFLPQQTEMTELIITPGERFEILVDFNDKGHSELICDLYGNTSFTALSIESEGNEGRNLADVDIQREYRIRDSSKPSQYRVFDMESRGMHSFTINGQTMDMNRVDFEVIGNRAEIWTVNNRENRDVLHSFHVHDVQFKILEFNGAPPPAHLAGPKDTVHLMPGDSVSFILNFEDYTGLYMYHCHFLEHEDLGMMGQFEVVR